MPKQRTRDTKIANYKCDGSMCLKCPLSKCVYDMGKKRMIFDENLGWVYVRAQSPNTILLDEQLYGGGTDD